MFFLEEDYFTPDEQENTAEENTQALEQFFDAKQSPKVEIDCFKLIFSTFLMKGCIYKIIFGYTCKFLKKLFKAHKFSSCKFDGIFLFYISVQTSPPPPLYSDN